VGKEVCVVLRGVEREREREREREMRKLNSCIESIYELKGLL
jgi:hypothetical protein